MLGAGLSQNARNPLIALQFSILRVSIDEHKPSYRNTYSTPCPSSACVHMATHITHAHKGEATQTTPGEK